MKPEPPPKDAVLVELRPDGLLFETRKCLLPGTLLAFELVMEERPLGLVAATDRCLVVDKDRRGYLYHSHVPFSSLPDGDRQLIALFIARGRGTPRIQPRS